MDLGISQHGLRERRPYTITYKFETRKRTLRISVTGLKPFIRFPNRLRNIASQFNIT